VPAIAAIGSIDDLELADTDDEPPDPPPRISATIASELDDWADGRAAISDAAAEAVAAADAAIVATVAVVVDAAAALVVGVVPATAAEPLPAVAATVGSVSMARRATAAIAQAVVLRTARFGTSMSASRCSRNRVQGLGWAELGRRP